MVNVSSIAGLKAFPAYGAYVAPKHAIQGLTNEASWRSSSCKRYRLILSDEASYIIGSTLTIDVGLVLFKISYPKK
ncbi:hypothetical protein [Paenibacillus polymyxa]|uniref:hypothetical protein n=1 Tax=Paenibacillus polymyxa TaxID=1406 RepID=UPI003C79CBD2